MQIKNIQKTTLVMILKLSKTIFAINKTTAIIEIIFIRFI